MTIYTRQTSEWLTIWHEVVGGPKRYLVTWWNLKTNIITTEWSWVHHADAELIHAGE